VITQALDSTRRARIFLLRNHAPFPPLLASAIQAAVTVRHPPAVSVRHFLTL
jgi:hypothetical protein